MFGDSVGSDDDGEGSGRGVEKMGSGGTEAAKAVEE